MSRANANQQLFICGRWLEDYRSKRISCSIFFSCHSSSFTSSTPAGLYSVLYVWSCSVMAPVQFIWLLFSVSGPCSVYLTPVQCVWPLFSMSGPCSVRLALVQCVWSMFSMSGACLVCLALFSMSGRCSVSGPCSWKSGSLFGTSCHCSECLALSTSDPWSVCLALVQIDWPPVQYVWLLVSMSGLCIHFWLPAQMPDPWSVCLAPIQYVWTPLSIWPFFQNVWPQIWYVCPLISMSGPFFKNVRPQARYTWPLISMFCRCPVSRVQYVWRLF
jgi:hypothetical protein